MAQFKGTVQGSRSKVSRLGGKDGGIKTTANGWNLGVEVFGFTQEDGSDVFYISTTTGSGSWKSTAIGTVRLGKNGRPVFTRVK